jgi:hypothetical protein
MVILLVRFVATMAEILRLCTDAGNRATIDNPNFSESLWGIAKLTTIGERLKSSTLRVEADRMEIDDASSITYAQASRPFITDHDHTLTGQDLAGDLNLLAGNNDVHVVMVARLGSDKRIHTPSSIEPHGHFRCIQRLENQKYILCSHDPAFKSILRENLYCYSWKALPYCCLVAGRLVLYEVYMLCRGDRWQRIRIWCRQQT